MAIIAQPVSEDLPQVTGCIALVNAKVVSAPGKPIQVSTIVMRDGLITDMGSHLKIPADAYRITADSLYAYPAFIDALSSIGVKNPEAEANKNTAGPPVNRGERPVIDEEGNASLEDAGITPFRSVRPVVDVKEKSISDWRAQGFAVAHIVPKGRMLPGKGSVIVLAGKVTDQLFWKEDVSMYAQWVGAGEGYPGTVIGVIAKWRELYHNSAQDLAQLASYSNAPMVPRPHYNQAHEALIPVVKGAMPVYFRAPKIKDISRALALQKDLGMKMVISDAEEAWYFKDQFRSGSIPLILSLALPEDKSEKKGDDKSDEKKPKSEKSDTTSIADSSKLAVVKVEIKDPEKEDFEKRRAQSLKEHYQQAGVLAKDGIPFSFGTLSGKPADFTKNIKLMIDNGLSADQALTALTTQPAKLLGIEKNAGTIEIGKMANILVSNKPLFEKDAAIRYMVVEGNLYAYEIKEKKPAHRNETHPTSSASANSVLTGTWSYTIEIPDAKKEGTLEFVEKDGILSGTITSADITSGNKDLESIVLDGNSVAFTFDFEIGGQLVVLEFDLKLNDESFDGNVSIADMGSFNITGQRISKPN
ncbi:MAG: amidohydrolase family protein [Saprospiraceae bacterium]